MMQENRSNRGLIVALLFALALALWIQFPRLVDPYVVEEDFRNFFWMNRFYDPTLFDETVLLQLYPRFVAVEIGSLYIPMDSGSPGYSILFWLASYLFQPVLFNKLLVFPLLGLSVFYMYRLGEKLRGPGTAFVLAMAFVVMNLSASSISTTLGGLQRSFITPLLLAEMYYLLMKRDGAAAFVIFLASLIYPPAFLLCAAMYALSLLQAPPPGHFWPGIAWRRLTPLLIAGGASILFLVPLLLQGGGQASPYATQTTERVSVFVDPVYQKGGRRQFFDIFPIIGRGGISLEGPEFLYILFSFGLAVLIWLVNRDAVRLLHPVLKQLFFASLICFAGTWLFFIITGSLILYLPSRYTMTSFALFGLIFVLIHGEEVLQRLAAAVWHQRQHLNRYILPLTLSALALVIFFPIQNESSKSRWLLLILVGLLLLLTWIAQRRRSAFPVAPQTNPGKFPLAGWFALGIPILFAGIQYTLLVTIDYYRATPTERALFTFLETLPQEAILAGSPCDLDSVLLFARRTVLFSCEQNHASAEVMRDGLMAYYAEDWSTVTAFCDRYNVSYLVVNQQSFTPEAIAAGDYFFEPYNSELRSTLSQQKTFVLADPVEAEKLFRYGELSVVSCR